MMEQPVSRNFFIAMSPQFFKKDIQTSGKIGNWGNFPMQKITAG
jgi:hypothetical protein